MKRMAIALVTGLMMWLGAPLVLGQQAPSTAAGTASAVPRLIAFSGVVKDSSGHALEGVVGVTFSLYKDQEGGASLWIETQNIEADSAGHYTVLLGATKPNGLPMELFTSGEARWLGIQAAGHAEQPRVLLVSAPYALKAADAETVGGLAPSAFVLATPASASSAASAPTPLAPPAVGTTPVTTAGGTVNRSLTPPLTLSVHRSLITGRTWASATRPQPPSWTCRAPPPCVGR